ncbi:MAG: electron transfer flavoprotein subunit beta/FixA family protein [Desulfamplus sp.]|nr:electron transfer flavoprotein subunit beta/FixA family protein [Desulfamplus sp.]
MKLNIIVCVKSVLNNMVPGGDRNSAENMELNPFDRPAIEMALDLIKEQTEGTLTVLSMGPKPATFGLYQAISIGANRAILICDPALKESDTYITAKVLSRALKRLQPFDIVLFGTRSADSDTGHVGPQTSQMLDIPFIGNIHSLTFNKKETYQEGLKYWIAERKSDGYVEKFEVEAHQTGVSFSVSSAFGESDFTSLHGIESAFSNKEIEIWDNLSLGLLPEETGVIASPTKIVAWNREKRVKRCLFIEGTPEQKAEQVAKQLSEAGFVG